MPQCRLVDSRPERTQVMVVAHSLELAELPVEIKSFLSYELHSPDAEHSLKSIRKHRRECPVFRIDVYPGDSPAPGYQREDCGRFSSLTARTLSPSVRTSVTSHQKELYP